jgi:hypothetical protein
VYKGREEECACAEKAWWGVQGKRGSVVGCAKEGRQRALMWRSGEETGLMLGVQRKRGRVVGQEERQACMRRIMCAAVEWLKIHGVDAGSAEEERKRGRVCKGREQRGREVECTREERKGVQGCVCKGGEAEW